MNQTQLKAALSAFLVIGAMACATAGPSPQLLRAREAFEKAKTGPALELNPADIHDSLVMLGAAEDAAREDPSSANAVHRAYLAEKRAELADAQGRTSLANRERDLANQELASLKDAKLKKTQGQLAQSEAQLGTERRERAASDERGQAQQEQQGLKDEQQGRKDEQQVLKDAQQGARDAQQGVKDEATKGQLADAAKAQQAAQSQLTAKQAELDSEHTARLASDQRAQESFDALAKVAAIRKEARGMVITLSGSVVFASGKSDLLPSAQHRLDPVAEALKANDRTILIEGHTDSLGKADFNQQLSERRARAVLDYLVSRSVPRERLRSAGLGSSRAVAENNTAEGRANNRRVEIVLEAPAVSQAQH